MSPKLHINANSRISTEQEKRGELRDSIEKIQKDIDTLKQKVDELSNKI